MDGRLRVGALDQRIATMGVVDTWEALCVPALTDLGQRTASLSCIDAEHLFSWTLTDAMHRVPGPTDPRRSRGVLLACAPESVTRWPSTGSAPRSPSAACRSALSVPTFR